MWPWMISGFYRLRDRNRTFARWGLGRLRRPKNLLFPAALAAKPPVQPEKSINWRDAVPPNLPKAKVLTKLQGARDGKQKTKDECQYLHSSFVFRLSSKALRQ